MSKQDDKSEVKIYSVVVAFIALLIVIYAIAGCSPRIVEKVVTRHDTTQVVKLDSVRLFERDSIYIREKGDTVFQYAERIRYRDRWRVDTLLTIRVDSVAVERETIKEVEKPLSGWKAAKLGAFWWLIGALLVSLGWIFRKPLLKLIGL